MIFISSCAGGVQNYIDKEAATKGARASGRPSDAKSPSAPSGVDGVTSSKLIMDELWSLFVMLHKSVRGMYLNLPVIRRLKHCGDAVLFQSSLQKPATL